MNTFPSEGWASPKPLTLSGRFITLTPLEPEADAEALFSGSHADGGELWRLLPVGPFADAQAMREWLRERVAVPDAIAFTVRDKTTGRPIGSISLMRITPAHGVAELGFIWYEPTAQRSTANTEANYLLLRHCFGTLGYRRMEWKCDTQNARSRAAAERLGYRFEGIFRQHMIVKGLNRDTTWLAMLDSEWPRVCAALELWLYSEDPRSLAAIRGFEAT